jgi:broad specificity phosphatase PhoE
MIYLARHGETDDNARGVVQGSIDTPLNDRGREQAHDLALRARAVRAVTVWTSHLRRAAETAEIVAGVLRTAVHVDERLAESRRGAWEGRSLAEIERTDPEGWAAWRRGGAEFRFPGGGESLGEHQERVLAALADLRRSSPSPALVVCHGGTIRCALCAADPRGLEAFYSIRVPNAALIPLPETTWALLRA